MAVIAMTREMGSLGKDVAAGLAERLGLTVVHHELVEHDIAEMAGLRESEVHHLLEGEASLLERWKLDRRRLSRYKSEEVLEIASKGNVLIRGWGATYLLRGVSHVICVRICAALSFREAVLMERLGVDDVAIARAEIERNDAAHNGTMQKLFAVHWKDAEHYAIVLNTARVPVGECVEVIARLTESPAFQETPQSRGGLMDKVIEARVRSALDKRYGGSVLSPAFEVAASGGKVTLIGGTSDPHMIVEASRLANSIEGVNHVDNKIVHFAFGSY